MVTVSCAAVNRELDLILHQEQLPQDVVEVCYRDNSMHEHAFPYRNPVSH